MSKPKFQIGQRVKILSDLYKNESRGVILSSAHLKTSWYIVSTNESNSILFDENELEAI